MLKSYIKGVFKIMCDIGYKQIEVINLFKEDIENNLYIKELNSFSKVCEYSNNILLLVYEDLEKVDKAKQICNERNISYYRETYYNSRYKGYCLEIICWANTLNPYKLNRYKEQKLN